MLRFLFCVLCVVSDAIKETRIHMYGWVSGVEVQREALSTVDGTDVFAPQYFAGGQ